MRKLALVPLVVLLTVMPAAEAKEVRKASVCGASGCREAEDRSALAHFGGDPSDPPKAAAPFYRMKFEVGGEGHYERFTIAYVPTAKAFRTTDPEGRLVWFRVEGESLNVFNAAVRGIAPFPAGKLGPLGSAIDTPEVRVDEVVLPPDDPAGGFPWVASLIAVGVVVSAGGVLLMTTGRPGSWLRSDRGSLP